MDGAAIMNCPKWTINMKFRPFPETYCPDATGLRVFSKDGSLERFRGQLLRNICKITWTNSHFGSIEENLRQEANYSIDWFNMRWKQSHQHTKKSKHHNLWGKVVWSAYPRRSNIQHGLVSYNTRKRLNMMFFRLNKKKVSWVYGGFPIGHNIITLIYRFFSFFSGFKTNVSISFIWLCQRIMTFHIRQQKILNAWISRLFFEFFRN